MAKQPGEGPYFNNPSKDPIRKSHKVDNAGNPVERPRVNFDKIINDGITKDLVSTGSGKLPRDVVSFMKAAAKPVEAPSLGERIDALREEIDSYIAKRVDEVAASAPGVPKGVIEQTMVGRAGGCRCLAAKMLREKEGAVTWPTTT